MTGTKALKEEKMLLLLLSLTDESQRDQVELIYYKYEKDLGIFARNKLKMLGINDRNAADDIVQNSFVKIIKMYDRIDFIDDPVKSFDKS